MATYAQNKKSIGRYIRKVVRYQVVLNPENPRDKKILDWLAATNTGQPKATQMKDSLVRYIDLQKLLSTEQI